MHQITGTTPTRPQIRWWSTAPGGPRVLLIMGFGMRGDLWRPQIEGLPGHQLAWFDNRGIGESEIGPKRAWTMKDMARDALRVMDSLGWDDAHLVGVSMGGMIAQECALLAESRFRSLTLIATHEGGRFGFLPSREGLKSWLEVNLAPDEERFAALERLLYPEAWLRTADREALRERMAAQIGRRARRATLLGQLHAVIRHDTGDRLRSLRLPTLIVKPCMDILIPPERSDRLRRRIAHAKLLEIPDAGHGAVFQSKDVINAALIEHFADAEAAAKSPTVHA